MRAWLRECRDRLAPGGLRGLLRNAGLTRRPRFAEVSPGTTALPRAVPYYQALLDGGQVVWGHIVQANNQAYHAGTEDLPAVVVFGAAGDGFDDPATIQEIAHRVFAVRSDPAAGPDQARIAQLLLASTTDYYHERLPDSLTDGRPVSLSTFLVHRRHLPTGRLTLPWFPLLVDAARSPLVMILPLRFWGPSLILHWDVAEANSVGHAGITGGGADRVPAVPPPVADEEPVRRAWLDNPLRLTAAAVAQVRQIIADCNLPAAAHLRVSSQRRGGEPVRAMQFAVEPLDPVRDLHTRCDGLDVATDVGSAPDFLGVVLDFQTGVEQVGFVFREG